MAEKIETYDAESRFESLKEKLPSAIKDLLEVETKEKKLRVNNISIKDNKDTSDLEAQTQAKVKGGSWSVPVAADLSIIDKNTGKTIDRKAVRIANLPKPTYLNSFLVGGNEYNVKTQKRLLPGVYTRIRDNGLLESWGNVEGAGFKINLDPESGVVKINVKGMTMPLYPLLAAMGAKESEVEKDWGKDVLAANKGLATVEQTGKYVNKLYEKMYRKKPEDLDEAGRGIRTFFEDRMKLSPESTAVTLGVPYTSVTPDTLIRSAGKLVRVHKGEEDPDDREDLGFKEMHSYDDHVMNRLTHWQVKNKVQGKLRRDLWKKDNVRDFISSSIVDPEIKHLFRATSLSEMAHQNNPLDIVGKQYGVTLTGPGGIENTDAITLAMRDVHPSEIGVIDILRTPESDKIGITTHLSKGARRVGRKPAATVINARTGQTEVVTSADLKSKVTAFSDQFDLSGKSPKPKKKHVEAFKGNEAYLAKGTDVDYIHPGVDSLFTMNSIPFVANNAEARASMATKMQGQAVPLKHAEAPAVQALQSDGRTFEEEIAEKFHWKAPASGKVTKVTGNAIHIKDGKGKTHKVSMYNDHPLGSYTYITNKPKVSAGDAVKKGQMVADSNFTDDGVLALGKHLRTAYMPFKGYNFNDGIVVSESAAEKLTSQHIRTFSVKGERDGVFSKKDFVKHYPDRVDSEQLEKLDDEGVIKPGQAVSPGDPVMAYLRKEEITTDDIMLGRLHSKLKNPYKDRSITYNGATPGVVTRVEKVGNGVNVYVKADEPATLGDKIVGRYANKGVITGVIPDKEMPKDADGNPVDVIFSPTALSSRKNPGQLQESATAKAARKAGMVYKVDNFAGNDKRKEVRDFLKSQGVSDKDELFDASGKSLGKVFVGDQYMYKLEHMVHNKMSARDRIGSGTYDIHGRPAKGGKEGAKAIGLMEINSLLSHGAMHNLREMATIKSDRNNDEYWKALIAGDPLPTVSHPFAWEKLMSYFKGLGVNPSQGKNISLTPMTDKQIVEMGDQEVTSPGMILAKNMKEEKGGLFDPYKTGGLAGEKWTHIKLVKPMPNPVFETPIKKLTGITKPQFEGILGGEKFVGKDGTVGTQDEAGRGAITGPEGIKKLLDNIDVQGQAEQLTGEAADLADRYKAEQDKTKKAAVASKLNDVNGRLKYLRALDKAKLKPSEAYMNGVLPVLPPVFRPIYSLPDGNLQSADLNYLYRDAMLTNNTLKSIEKLPSMPYKQKAPHYMSLYQNMRGLAGTGGALDFRNSKGILDTIHGTGSSKEGFFQKDVLQKRLDMVGRSTIVPEPSLHVDTAEIPEDMAWTMYKPFVVKELGNVGYRGLDAIEEYEARTESAKMALDKSMKDRPILLNRFPTLHKFGIMAFKPKIGTEKTIKISPMVTKGFGADFDGDEMTVHVTVTDEAAKEAAGMMPSKNLFHVARKSVMMVPEEESVIGLNIASKFGKKTQKKYSSPASLAEDYKKGNIEVDDVVTLKGKQTTAGRELMKASLPSGIKLPDVFDKKTMTSLLIDVAEKHPRSYSSTVLGLKSVGDLAGFEKGYSLGLDALDVKPDGRRILDSANKKTVEILNKPWDQKRKNAEIVKAHTEAGLKFEDYLAENEQQNPFVEMALVGAKGNMGQVRQIVGAGGISTSIKGTPLPLPLTRSYAEGMSMGQYVTSNYAGRRGAVTKRLGVSIPGAYGKELASTVMGLRVTENDCGTVKGQMMDVSDINASDRFIVGNVKKGNRVLAKRNDTMSPSMAKKLRGSGVKKVSVRSPIYCEAKDGVCQKCSGLDEHGQINDMGANVGVKASQAMVEPMTQMSMGAIHEGHSLSGESGLDSLPRIMQITRLPAIFPHNSVLSEADGIVEGIEEVSTGGQRVSIGGKTHFIPPNRLMKVDKGDFVTKGDSLSSGIENPRDTLRLKGMDATRQYMVDFLSDSYEKGSGPMTRKTFETVVKGITDRTMVLDSDPSDDFIPGDITSLSKIEALNRKKSSVVPLSKSNGLRLGTQYGAINAGTEIDDIIMKELKSAGHRDILAGKNVISHEPILMGVNQAPLKSADWMARMGFREVKGAVLEAAGKGLESDIAGINPIPSIAYGPTVANTFKKYEGGDLPPMDPVELPEWAR